MYIGNCIIMYLCACGPATRADLLKECEDQSTDDLNTFPDVMLELERSGYIRAEPYDTWTAWELTSAGYELAATLV